MKNTPDKKSLDRRVAQLEVPESLYRADMELHDRSQQFSTRGELPDLSRFPFFLHWDNATKSVRDGRDDSTSVTE